MDYTRRVAMVRLGIEVLLERELRLLSGARVGVVVHPASVLSNLVHTVDALAARPGVRLVSLFGPQHGARGEKQDNMIESEHYRDPETGLPVHSLYSEVRKPTEAMLADVDVLLYDLQDVGTRIYTFIYTMSYCMEACREYGKRFVVLDRPNPIGGAAVEGNVLEPECRSFVGRYPLPMRHGMTVGELALLFNAEFGIGCDLTVVPMEGWRRRSWFDDTGLPWVSPSPNIPTFETTIVYPGTVLVEGTRLSEGRGTTRPFELVGAPYVEAQRLAAHMNGLGLPGVYFRAAYFQPCFHKWTGEVCGGVQIHVTDRQAFEPYLAGVALLAGVRALHPDQFAWRDPPYEYEHERLPIQLLSGSRSIVAAMESGATPEQLRASWREDVERFRAARAQYLLYD